MSETKLGRGIRRAGLGGVLALTLAGCGAGNSSSRRCKEFHSEINPGSLTVLETDKTANGTFTYIISNNIGSISVRQTLQPDGHNVVLDVPSLEQKSLPTFQTGNMDFHEPGNFEKITVDAQTNPTESPVGFQSVFCPAPQQV
jgi:hypothetical protein